jgi:tRNA (guanine-N7-)-methyltransferase
LKIHKIRSFIRRQGRTTPGQQRAIDRLWPIYGLEQNHVINYKDIFGRTAPLIVEIGFGNGESITEMAAKQTDNDYLGIEVHKPGIGHLLLQLEQLEINNVRILCYDAVEILEKNITDNSLAGIHLFFPDPWPKKRHHKRRIVQTEFVDLVTCKLQPGGYFHAATDWQDYAEHMLVVLQKQPNLINQSSDQTYCERPDYRPVTKFERRGLALGHGVWDLIFRKNSN